MRRTLTPCAVTRSGQYLPLKRVAFADRRIAETFLQDALHQNPALLPVDDIDTAFGPLASLGRELAAIDNLFISPTGRLTLVETKLWRNPESGREVVGQILDYATTLSAWSSEDLEREVRANSYSPLQAGDSLYRYVARCFPQDVLPEAEFIDALQKTLRTGRFLLLIVGDGIREGVERMLDHLHEHPQRHFTFGLVELGIYENPDALGGRIILPSLLAKTTEVVRAVVRVETTGPASVSVVTARDEEEASAGYRRRTLSEDEFLQALPNATTRHLYERLFAFAAETGLEKTWRANSVSLRLPDPTGSGYEFTLLVLATDGHIIFGWLANTLARIGLPVTIASDYVQHLCAIFPDVSPHPSGPGVLSRKLTTSEVVAHFDPFTAAIRQTVNDIKAACASAGASNGNP